MGPQSVSNLKIWHEGMALAKSSYALTSDWPKSELFGLTGQIRRAAVSVPANLAEGRGRGSRAEMARYGRIALGSLYELDTLLQLGLELGFGKQESITEIRERVSVLSRQISAFIQTKRAAQ
jgi:four helix bundle protein